MTDFAELRKRAEDARDGDPGLSNEYIAFMDYATPGAVLALLDEVDASRAKAKKTEYPPEFLAAMATMKAAGTAWRAGTTPSAAFKAWKARVAAGATMIEIFAGTEKYARYCKATGCEVKQAQTFFGPGEYFAADWTIPKATGRKGQLHGSIGEQDFNAGIRADGSF